MQIFPRVTLERSYRFAEALAQFLPVDAALVETVRLADQDLLDQLRIGHDMQGKTWRPNAIEVAKTEAGTRGECGRITQECDGVAHPTHRYLHSLAVLIRHARTLPRSLPRVR
jgi:hypothetical protein